MYSRPSNNSALNVKNISETKIIIIPNKRKMVNLLDILIFFKEKVGILLIKKTATMTTRYGVNFLISKFNWMSESS